MSTEAVYVASRIPDRTRCACLHYPAGKWSTALGPWTLLCMQRFNKSRYASVSVDRPFLVGENLEHQRHF